MVEFTVLNYPEATHGEVKDFVRLVQKGGAVDKCYIVQGIQRQGAKMVFAKIDGTVVGVAALKVPLERYRNGLEGEAKSGHLIPQGLYPFELGYVAVSQDYGRKGIGKALVGRVLALSEGHGLMTKVNGCIYSPSLRCATPSHQRGHLSSALSGL